MYFTDETLDEWAENMDLDRRLAQEEENRNETQVIEDLELQDRKQTEAQANCYHDFDLEAGGTQVQHNGAFELLDVCVKCSAIRHTGKWTSVL